MAKKKTNKQPAALSPERFLKEKANKLPIYKCFISKNYQEAGEAMVTVSRERGNGKLCVANFIVDIYCLGVKDVFGNVNMEKEQFADCIEKNDEYLEECSYDLAHNLIYGAVEFAEEADIEPAEPYKLWQYILSEDTDDIPLIEIEFGRNGKYLLVTDAGTKEAKLIPKLKEKLGDNFDFILGDGNEPLDDYPDEEEDYLEEERRLFHYEYPEYPAAPKLHHPFLKDLLLDEDYNESLPKKEVERILALPKEEVEEDLLNLILWEIGQTYSLIQEDPAYIPDNYLILQALLLLAIMESKKGFTAAMEVLRQSGDFIDNHLNIEACEYILPAMINSPLGKEELDEIRKYLDEKGHSPRAVIILTELFPQIAVKYPHLKDEVVSILKDVMNKMPERLKSEEWYTSEVPGFFISSLLDMNTEELMPEVEKVFATGWVDPSICGDLDEVKQEMKIPHTGLEGVTITSKETLMKYLTE